MTLTITNTDQITEINGVPARVWTGRTDSGIEVHCFITRIAVQKDQDCTQFERELQETAPLKTQEVWPLRMIL